MANLSKSELDAIHAERTKFFTPQWFGDLFSGRLSPGDTFWIGNYGPALIVVPLLVIVALFTAMAVPGHLGPLFGSFAIGAGIYRVLVLAGLVRSVIRTSGPKVWRWIGVFWTVFEAVMLIWLGLRLFGG
ncbi:MAG: hypothetical protein JXR35_13855 [Rhodobacteraceae bacterium]|nr:hypothetical protein [Paracoccaceae bacterium]